MGMMTPVWLKCRFGCKIRYEADITADGVLGYYLRRYDSPGLEPVREPLKTAYVQARCLVHKETLSFKPIKCAPSSEACSDACTKATGAECKCSCNGQNHGIEA